MAHYLEPLHEGGRQIVLDKAVVLIGRQAECDVILNDSRKVSRKHCCIAQVNDTYVVRDLASMNGVRVNGERIEREAPLDIGDEISFGDVRYVLRDTKANPVSNANGSSIDAGNQESVAEESEPGEAVSVAESVDAPPVDDAPAVEKKPKRPAYRQPANISQKFPVPISEEDADVDFAIEPSIQLDRLPADDAPAGESPPREAQPDDDVIILDDGSRSDDVAV